MDTKEQNCTKIRASSLSHYSDCPRRAAARMFGAEIEGYGFKLKQNKTSIGAAVGTATHEAVETAILLKRESLPYVDVMNTVAELSISKSISEGMIWDKTTPTKAVAIAQAVRQARSVLGEIPDIESVVMEEEFKVSLGGSFILSGHIDIRGESTSSIIDIKTGTMRRANQAQYGAYSLLCRSRGIDIKVLKEIYARRVGYSKPQPPCIVVSFDVTQAEEVAWYTLERLIADVTAFRKTGNIWMWLPNPNSLMCSADYCPAFNTSFCNCHKKIIEEV